MKIITTKSLGKFIKNNITIINYFLLASLFISSFIVGFVPQIPVWILLITIPICLISMILFYIKSYSYTHKKWVYCKKHKSDSKIYSKKYFKYIYLSLFLLIPLFNWITILSIIKYETKTINKEEIICKKDHLEIRSGVIKTRSKKLSEDRVEEFNKEF